MPPDPASWLPASRQHYQTKCPGNCPTLALAGSMYCMPPVFKSKLWQFTSVLIEKLVIFLIGKLQWIDFI